MAEVERNDWKRMCLIVGAGPAGCLRAAFG